jgi:ubiquinone/menaquinone biosynthesis C-methylase UbiE
VVRAGYQLFLFTVARAIGFLLTGRLWPFTYLARSVRQFLSPSQFVDRLQSLRSQVQYVPIAHGLASLYLATKDA